MNKLNCTVLALIFAVLGGCASTFGDVVGTGAFGTNNPAEPYPVGSLVQMD